MSKSGITPPKPNKSLVTAFATTTFTRILVKSKATRCNDVDVALIDVDNFSGSHPITLGTRGRHGDLSLAACFRHSPIPPPSSKLPKLAPLPQSIYHFLVLQSKDDDSRTNSSLYRRTQMELQRFVLHTAYLSMRAYGAFYTQRSDLRLRFLKVCPWSALYLRSLTELELQCGLMVSFA